ncbi:MAG: hypothetical protein ABIQ35_12725 [Verrucomicrobiota bacterium]
MPFIKLSHVKSAEPTAADFFVNIDYITRIVPREGGSTLLMHDGSSVAVQQPADTIADYVDQLESTRGAARIDLSRE